MKAKSSSISVEIITQVNKHKVVFCVKLCIPVGILLLFVSAVKTLTKSPGIPQALACGWIGASRLRDAFDP